MHSHLSTSQSCSMTGRDDCTTEGKCPGWGWFDGADLLRCDECAAFADDGEALSHVRECLPCQAILGAEVAASLVEHQALGLAPGRSVCPECGE